MRRFDCNFNFTGRYNTIRNNLKEHYKDDLEIIEKQWQMFNVTGPLIMDNFYNDSLELNVGDRSFNKAITDFEELLMLDCHHIVLFGCAGCGKSTFVHEIVRQWVKGEQQWTEKFWFIFLIRLGDISETDATTVYSLFQKCLGYNDAIAVGQWLKNTVLMQHSLFIFDGLDELKYTLCDDINHLIFSKPPLIAKVIVTVRIGNRLEELKANSIMSLYVKLNGFNDEGTKNQLRKFFINPNEIAPHLLDLLKVPLYNTLFCLLHENDVGIRFINKCYAIDKFIQFQCCRYRKSSQISNLDI